MGLLQRGTAVGRPDHGARLVRCGVRWAGRRMSVPREVLELLQSIRGRRKDGITATLHINGEDLPFLSSSSRYVYDLSGTDYVLKAHRAARAWEAGQSFAE